MPGEPKEEVPEGFKVTAILVAYNEEDIVGAAIEHLVAQGVSVYFLDHGSTDGTVEEARRFLGRGVIEIDRMEEGGGPSGDAGGVRWEGILRRKEALAEQLSSSWFIHHDADEFRESPWPQLSLRQALYRVDAQGFNAVDFEVLQFRPTHDGYRKGDDPLDAFRYYEPGLHFDKLQIKCWKKAPQVDLVSTGGHDARFPGRRVFPVRFVLRHYPVRTQAQGVRKVFSERIPRFDAEERARGWHRQYQGLRAQDSFIRSPAELQAYDAESVRQRLWIEHRGMEELAARLEASLRESKAAERQLALFSGDLEWYRREWPAREAELLQAREKLRIAESELAAQRDTSAHLAARIEELLSSWSWRGTALARRALKRLRGF